MAQLPMVTKLGLDLMIMTDDNEQGFVSGALIFQPLQHLMRLQELHLACGMWNGEVSPDPLGKS